MRFDVAIIGGGPAGYTAAEKAGKAGLKTILFEKKNLGGVCLNEGCIPTKTLLYSAKTYDNARHASKYAISASDVSFDLPKIIARKNKVVRKLVLGIKAKLAAASVTVVTGEAYIADKNHIRCGEETYECDKLIVCTGSETFIPPVAGLDGLEFWTHREALECKQLPQSLVIVGGGVIGMEFASFFNSLGTNVTVVEMMDEILGATDKEISGMLRTEYAKRGITFLLGTKVTAVGKNGENYTVNYEKGEDKGMVEAEKLMMSVGRRPVTKGFGLENLHLEADERGRIKVDAHQQASAEGVYLCGDIDGVSLLAHTAVREAETAVHHITGKADNMSYKAIPGVVYTNPEVASVGMSEEQVKDAGIDHEVKKLPMAYSGRFVAENEGVNGLCKLIVGADKRLLGAHVIGNPASEIITLAGMAIEMGVTTEEWERVVFPHPTVCEIFKETIA